MSDIQRNELMLLQNDILGDIKKAENKLDTKIFKVSSSLDELKEKFEDKINHLEKDFKILLQKNETLKGNDSNEDKIYSKINQIYFLHIFYIPPPFLAIINKKRPPTPWRRWS